MASFTLAATGSWFLFYTPSPDSPIPYLKGDTRWPDSLIRSMGQERLLAQLLIYTPPQDASGKESGAVAPEVGPLPGGYCLKGLELAQYLRQSDVLQRRTRLPLLFFADNPVLHNNQFSDLSPFPSPGTIAANPGKNHFGQLNRLFVAQSEALGLNLIAPFDLSAPWRDTSEQDRLLRNLMQKSIVAGARGLSAFDLNMADTLPPMAQVLQSLSRMHSRGLGLLVFEGKVKGDGAPGLLREGFLSRYLNEKFAYQGLIAGVVSKEAPLEYWIKAGADLFISESPPSVLIPQMKKALDQGYWRRNALRRSLRKVFLAKQWMISGSFNGESQGYRQLQTRIYSNREKISGLKTDREAVEKHFRKGNWEAINYRFREYGLVLSNNSGGRIPWQRLEGMEFILWSPGSRAYPVFEAVAGKYAPLRKTGGKVAQTVLGGLPDTARGVVLALLDPDYANPVTDTLLRDALEVVRQQCPLVVVNFGIPQLHKVLGPTFTTIHAFEHHTDIESLAAQLFFGGVGARGQWPAYDSTGPVVQQVAAIRLGFAPPERSEVAPEKLVGIDAIVRSAVADKIIPGCQVLVAKDGRIIYNKVFGRHTFEAGEEAVRPDDLYDIASLTKIAATTLAVMRLYEDRKIALNDRLDRHLPWLVGKETGKIQLKSLLTHQSGLPAGLPSGKYVKARKNARRPCEGCFCNKKGRGYDIEVAAGLFFSRKCKAELLERVAALQPSRKRSYRYSDVNFWLLQQVVETKTGEPLDGYLEKNFYRPLGLRHTHFKPAGILPITSIVPGEGEKGWRKKLVRGFVHDPSAALLGGVCGHAGLFSNAGDLAVIMQLLLNGGAYGGRQWFEPQTVALFTQKTFGNHRSLGFDHPSRENRHARARTAPPGVFGHSGFTGTCAWADPERRLVFVFLSNRTFPDDEKRRFIRKNIRGRIHQVAYDAVWTYSPELPSLD